MVAVTYDPSNAARIAAKPGHVAGIAPRKGLFARFMAALIESRMRHAQREIMMHRHLLPSGHDMSLVKPVSGDMPLGGW